MHARLQAGIAAPRWAADGGLLSSAAMFLHGKALCYLDQLLGSCADQTRGVPLQIWGTCMCGPGAGPGPQAVSWVDSGLIRQVDFAWL